MFLIKLSTLVENLLYVFCCLHDLSSLVIELLVNLTFNLFSTLNGSPWRLGPLEFLRIKTMAR